MSSSLALRMATFKQVVLSNFCPAIAVLVKCDCGYCEMETLKSNNSSATKR